MATNGFRVRTTFGAVAVLGLSLLAPVGVVAAAPPAAEADRGVHGTGTPYVNPVSKGFADTYADPAVIRGKDGYWYAYGTTDPLREGEGDRHLLPMSRSTDLVNWEYVGDAFTEETIPDWADTSRGAALWAPDIRYVDGQYRLYYVVTETTETGVPETTTEINDNAIGVAYSDSPTGPWEDSGDPVIDPRRRDVDNYLWTFDPHHVTGPDGREFLFYGSYYGGIFVTELNDDGSEAVGTATQVAIDNKYEGAYVIRRNGWWYLFASSANCCAGPTTGYSVHVGRSRNLTGPYVDREGVPLNQSRAGGTPVIAPNGNRWIGTGHNAVVTDLAGQDWIVYHAIDRNDPYLDGTDGINERPMLIDRLDWINGWPTARAGAWASEDRQKGPITGGSTVTGFASGTGGFTTTGPWRRMSDDQSGMALVSTGQGEHRAYTHKAIKGKVRVEADVRTGGSAMGEHGLFAAARPGDRHSGIAAVIDPKARTLAVRVMDDRGRVTGSRSVPLPANYEPDDWHSLVLEIRGGTARAELTHARLFDPLGEVTMNLPRNTGVEGVAGAFAKGSGTWIDNLSALPAADLVTKAVAPPRPGRLLQGPSDEFDGGIEAGWTRVRDPQVSVAGGRLVWPVESTDLTGDSDNAGLLLRDAPAGNWTAETKLTIDLGVNDIRNYQQGGIIAYADDDNFARLSHVAIWNTRQTEFGREMPYAGRLSYGGTIVGPPADTTWLRLTHRTDRNGEREVRASTSRDGRTWVHGGVWTFAAGTDLQIGLISHGNQGGEPATSQFDYFRVYAD
jgi:arabinan endo-1,5-alpha-L-arabinosidase